MNLQPARGYPKISFGIIVLNGEPFTRCCLRSIYPYAHQIVVAEGAAPAAACIASPAGHSTDGTLEVLRAFQREEDPEKKVVVLTAEDEGHPDGFWPGEKDEQSRACAARADGDYLWQVDIDEFYRDEDARNILAMLASDPKITAVSFRQIAFWGGFDLIADGWHLRAGDNLRDRIFRWGKGYRYAGHRPPTVLDPGGRDLRTIRWVRGNTLARRGIFLYHYSLVFPKQVVEKCRYHSAAGWATRPLASEWAREVFLELRNPYRVHNVYHFPSWLEKFKGTHPAQIECLRRDLDEGRVRIERRRTDDARAVLNSFRYTCGRFGLKAVEPLNRCLRKPLLSVWKHPVVESVKKRHPWVCRARRQF